MCGARWFDLAWSRGGAALVGIGALWAVTEGLAASFGWGIAARAITICSGVIPVLMVAHGPAVPPEAEQARAAASSQRRR